MSYKAIEFEVEDQVAIVTLNRPDRMNAWNDTMGGELAQALTHCDGNPEIRAVVVTGKGKAFCAGADMSGGGKTFGDFSKRRSERPKPAAAEDGYAGPFPWQISKPVFAAINGHAIGVGVTYPMTCDVRIVAEDAKIQFAFTRRGILPELWSHVIVPRVAGLSNAADILLSGRMLRGTEFAALGLASEALPADQVLPATLERARELRNAAPVSVAISKRLIWEGLSASLPEMGKRESKLFAWTSQQPDAREGVASFLEKRPPEWKLDPAKDMPEL
jgi:enoyl-CoA hydratase/carnithine racemase